MGSPELGSGGRNPQFRKTLTRDEDMNANETAEKDKVEIRRVGRHHVHLIINGKLEQSVHGRENIFKLREQYPDATVTF
jgi:hypothetical protein